MQTNPVSCGEFCNEFSIHRADYDIDNDRVLAELLFSDQPLSAATKKYIKQSYSIWAEPKCHDLPMADYYEISTEKIISDKLKGLFELLGVKGEYVPIKTLNNTNKSLGAYYLAHFYPIIDCFDYERSEYKWVERKSGRFPRKLKLLVLDESKVTEDSPLFRIKHFEEKIIVEDRLKVAIEEANVKGVLFLPLPVQEFDATKLIRQYEKDCSNRKKANNK
jgi:hypothetical protein